MSPAAEMLKYMAIGLGGIGALALVGILIGRGMQHRAEVVENRTACPCGEQTNCVLADYLGICNAQGRTQFIRGGRVELRPSWQWAMRWSIFGIMLILFIVGLCTGWGPIRSFSGSPGFLVAFGGLLWKYTEQFFRRLWRR